jgi:uncharacterized protein (DUF58 family)
MLTERKARSFLDPKVLARLSSLPLTARRPMLGQVSGRHVSPHRGASVEFAEYRKYVPGDDLRRLDWRAFGRSDRFYIKEFEADTNLRLYLIVDTSGSMDFGSVGCSKLEYARRLGAALAYLAVQQGDSVGLTCISEKKVQNLPARRNPAHLTVVFDQLEEARCQGPTRLDELLHELAETTRQRSLIVILSDFFLDAERWRGCFEHLRFRKHDVAAFHLLDPEEIDFNFQRPTRFLDMEGGPAIFVEPSEIAQRYQRAVGEYLDAIRRIALETGVDYQRVSIDRSHESVLTDFLVARNRGSGRR